MQLNKFAGETGEVYGAEDRTCPIHSLLQEHETCMVRGSASKGRGDDRSEAWTDARTSGAVVAEEENKREQTTSAGTVTTSALQ